MNALDELRKLSIPDSRKISISLLKTEASKMNLSKLQETLGLIEKEKYQSEKELEKLKNLDFNYLIQEDAIQATLSKAPDILWNQIDLALKVNKEFDIKPYREALQSAILNLDTYNIVSSGSRLSVNIRIDLNRTAGNSFSYGRAVSATRGQLNIGIMPTEAYAKGDVTASTFWYEKIYKPGRDLGRAFVWRGRKDKRSQVDKTAEFKAKYWKTIQTRISNFNSVAPFWELLDKGAFNLVSDRGGIPLPNFKPTNFVYKSELELRNFFKETFHSIEDVFLKEVNKFILEYKNYINKVKELESIFKKLIAIATGRLKVSKLKFISDKEIEKRFGTDMIIYNQQIALAYKLIVEQIGSESIMRVDKQKLQLLLEQLATGEALTRVRIGHGIRVRTLEIEQKLRYNR